VGVVGSSPIEPTNEIAQYPCSTIGNDAVPSRGMRHFRLGSAFSAAAPMHVRCYS
jgi:hypothetical protein